MPRKLIVQSHISLDGYIASGTSSDYGVEDWITTVWTQDVKDYITALSNRVDLILLGRKTAEDFIPAWSGPMKDVPGADFINSTPKVVFSTTLAGSEHWGEGVKVVDGASGGMENEVRRLKAVEGKDMIVYGGVRAVQTLVAAGLVDEIFVMVEQVTLGEGGRLFEGNPKASWEVLEAKRMDCGSALLHYRRKE